MRLRGWPLHVLTMELRKLFSYRIDFWLQFVGSVLSTVAVSYYLWRAVYNANHVSVLGGFTFPQMIFYYVLAPLIDRCVRGNDQGNYSTDIYDGSLTRYLIYPVSLTGYKYVSQLAAVLIGVMQLFIALGVYTLFFKVPYADGFGPLQFALGLTGIFAAGILFYLMMSIIETAAFWAENVWSLLVMLRFTVMFLGGVTVPLTLFPDWLTRILRFTPFPYLVAFHLRTLTGEIAPGEWAAGMAVICCWIAAFMVVIHVVMNRALRQYTGVGI